MGGGTKEQNLSGRKYKTTTKDIQRKYKTTTYKENTNTKMGGGTKEPNQRKK